MAKFGEDQKFEVDRMKIKHLLLDRGWTQAKLAEEAEVSEGVVANILNGSGTRLETAARLALALDRNPVDILVIKGFPEPEPQGYPAPQFEGQAALASA